MIIIDIVIFIFCFYSIKRNFSIALSVCLIERRMLSVVLGWLLFYCLFTVDPKANKTSRQLRRRMSDRLIAISFFFFSSLENIDILKQMLSLHSAVLLNQSINFTSMPVVRWPNSFLVFLLLYASSFISSLSIFPHHIHAHPIRVLKSKKIQERERKIVGIQTLRIV